MSKYLFFDIDGTLRGKSRMIHEKTRAALLRLHGEGHKLFICSGRSPASIKGAVVRDIPFDGIIACAGGCVIIDGKCVYEHDIELSVLRKVLCTFRDMDIPYSLETREAIYESGAFTEYQNQKRRAFHKGHPEILEKFEKESREFTYRPLEAFDDTAIGVPKLAFIAREPDKFSEIRPMLEEHFYIVTFMENEESIDGELISKTCTKADGVRKVLEYFHADWEDTIAFGDSMNDYQMIQAVHTGAVYEHAPDALKRQAKYFFKDPDEAGIYHTLVDMGLYRE